MARYIPLAMAALALFTLTLAARAADVPYVSGGVGLDERAALHAKERDYNLKVVAAKKTGEYVAAVKIVIESTKKEPLLDTTMDGPILLAKLPPGTYTIRATAEGETLTRTAVVGAQGLTHVDFRF